MALGGADDVLASERVDHVGDRGARCVCIGFLDPTLGDQISFQHVAGDCLHAIGHADSIFQVGWRFDDGVQQDVEEALLVGV